MKIIPAIDLMNGQVVRLYKGNPGQKKVYSDDPAGVAKRWESAGADMLHLVDLDATLGRGSNMPVIKKILDSAGIPVQVAGGLRDRAAVYDAARTSDRIVLGTLAFGNRRLLGEILAELGPERVVVSVDHRDGQVATHGWQKSAGVRPLDAMNGFCDMGFTEFLLTNIGRDGTLQGPDLEFLEEACRIPGADVIASGGISGAGDVADVQRRNAYGVILGKALYENMVSIEEAKRM